MNNELCAACSKNNDDNHSYYCEADCGRIFCSLECAQLESYEDTFPNCCPGIYWCGMCRAEYLDFAKGHLFIPHSHSYNSDLQLYVNQEYTNGAFIGKCMKCNIWSYEFGSFTNLPGRCEGQACASNTFVNLDDDY